MCATTPRCGVNSRRPTCSASLCPRSRRQRARVPGAGAASRRGGLERRPGAGVCHPAAWRRHHRPARRRQHSSSATCPASSTANTLLTAGLTEPGRSDPAEPCDHRAPRRRQLAPRRDQRAGARGATRRHDRRSRHPDDGDVGVFLVDADSHGVEIRPATTTNGEPHADVLLDGASRFRTTGPAIGAGHRSTRCTRERSSGCAPSSSASLSVRLRWPRRTPPDANSSADRSAAFRPCSSGWPTPSSTSRPSAGPCGRPPGGCDQGAPPGRAARIAKFWAAEAGSRVAATAQQVHGGIGIDITYPLFRYFLWSKHNELTLGSASAQLARLGASYVTNRAREEQKRFQYDHHLPHHPR